MSSSADSGKQFNLDSHKLYYHLDRVAEFQKNKDCFPLYMEVSPVGLCNHRCIFCAYDYIEYPNRKLDKERFLHFIEEVSQCGLRSMLYAGEGEPLIHPDIATFVQYTKKNNIDAGMFSNGAFLKEKLAQNLLPYLTFLRFSFNGGNAPTYARTHRVSEKVFETVVKNITYATNFRTQNNLKVDLGSQFVLLPENKDSLLDAIKTMKEAGVDFISVKPFVFQNENQQYQGGQVFNMAEIKDLVKEAQKYSSDTFKVIFRENAFENSHKERDYKHCRGCSFITVLNSAGDLATCLPYWDKQDFVYGNIYKNSFVEIWKGQKRKDIKHFLENDLDVKKCPSNCRPNAINAFLEDILEPRVKHINFI